MQYFSLFNRPQQPMHGVRFDGQRLNAIPELIIYMFGGHRNAPRQNKTVFHPLLCPCIPCDPWLSGRHPSGTARPTAKHVRIEGSRFAGSDRPDHAHIVTVRQVIPQAGLRVVVRDLLRLFLRGVTTQHAGDLFLQSKP